jgi:hypothetical protein
VIAPALARRSPPVDPLLPGVALAFLSGCLFGLLFAYALGWLG